MGDRTVDENYSEPGPGRTTGGQILVVMNLRRALSRLILGELWEGGTRTG